jgi:hypothetical protein
MHNSLGQQANRRLAAELFSAYVAPLHARMRLRADALDG